MKRGRGRFSSSVDRIWGNKKLRVVTRGRGEKQRNVENEEVVVDIITDMNRAKRVESDDKSIFFLVSSSRNSVCVCVCVRAVLCMTRCR